jgi:hypothetical protein
VPNNAVWFINRPIQIRFTQDVDFDTVSLNTINIRQMNGAPSVGEFSQPILANGTVDRRTVEFQPRCPTDSTLSDAGFQPGGVMYELKILGTSAATGLTVQSTQGEALLVSETRVFSTPVGTTPTELFFDTHIGPPQPLVRSVGDVGLDFSHVQVGQDPNNRIYFERAANGQVALESGAVLDLNLESNPDSQIALKLVFNQPVQPFSSNISSQRLPWQYLDQGGVWQNLGTSVTLEANCTFAGAVVAIRPQGILPPGAKLRSIISTEFSDLVGETNTLVQFDHAPADTRAAPMVLADSIEEEFLSDVREDSTASVGEPLADWSDGGLSARFSFSGKGGNGGKFDWELKPGKLFILDTTTTTLTGGENFQPTTQQVVIDGVMDVRNLRIGVGAQLEVQGPNPLLILASGKVEILGEIDIGGTNTKGVVTLNTTNQPQPGAIGNAGGGRGGIGSPLTNSSSPGGTRGLGAFNTPDGGGEGGETSWIDSNNNLNARRGNGGGGGFFGANQLSLPGAMGKFDQEFIGLDAENGFANLITTALTPPKGAISGLTPPRSGTRGPSPFTDPDPTNNFWGSMFDSSQGAILVGELLKPHAGAGGGGGGDASFTNGQVFPMVPFDPQGDEKGAGGGGGGGSLTILSLGDIVFGPFGQIRCRGGTGGGGENTNFLDRVGGGSGGGSGGHVILQTSARIDMSQTGTGGTPPPGYQNVAIMATGGEGGAGAGDQGGASVGLQGSVEKTPTNDACPPGYPMPTTPPTLNACLGHVHGAGGDGGPGLIQLHTPNGLGGGDIILPPGKTLRDICKPEPIYATATQRLVPVFGRNSTAVSVWIPLGLGGFDAGATAAPFFKNGTFLFGDVDPVTGLVQTTGEIVNAQPPIIGPDPVVNQGVGLPYISATDPRTIVLDASGLIGTGDEVYLQNLGLTEHFVLELSQISNPSVRERFDVVSLDYDASAQTLTASTSTLDDPLSSFTPFGGPAASLSPSFFRIRSEGNLDSLPDSATVRIRFQAAPATFAGAPDLTNVIPGPTPMDWTSDPAVLNSALLNADIRFFRFDVRFDIDALNLGLNPDNPIPTVEFLRFPFRY